MSTQQSAASLAGSLLALDLSLTFRRAASRFYYYLRADDDTGRDTWWQVRGSYSTGSAQGSAVGTVSPSSGTGSQQTFALDYFDPSGFAGIASG